MVRDIKIGVVGVGMVGGQVLRYFQDVRGLKRGENLFAFDIDPTKGLNDDVDKAEVVFICVPTPMRKDGSIDLGPVEDAFARLTGTKVIVLKSTVAPGTTEKMQKKYPNHKIVFNPEFLTETQAWGDFINPDRQIVAPTNVSQDVAGDILDLLPIGNFKSPGHLTTYDYILLWATEAELGKYASNIFGALKVVFGNIIADLCDGLRFYSDKEKLDVHIEYDRVKYMFAQDKRIGPYWLDVLYGGYRGFGGACFPKDYSEFIQFLEYLLEYVKTNGGSKNLITLLEKGLAVHKAVWDYNEALLKTQGFSVEDVAKSVRFIKLQHNKKD